MLESIFFVLLGLFVGYVLLNKERRTSFFCMLRNKPEPEKEKDVPTIYKHRTHTGRHGSYRPVRK